MSQFFGVKRATPEGASKVGSLNPLAPAEIALGEPAIDFPKKVVVKLMHLNRLLDLWWAGSYMLMSERAIEIMKGVGEKHFETFPVTLEAKGVSPNTSAMRIVNLLDGVPCLDRAASDFDENDDGIWDIRRLCLREGNISADRHLFRLAEHIGVIIARNDFAERFDAEKLQGVKFVVTVHLLKTGAADSW